MNGNRRTCFMRFTYTDDRNRAKVKNAEQNYSNAYTNMHLQINKNEMPRK